MLGWSQGVSFSSSCRPRLDIVSVRTSIGRNKPRSKNDPYGNELAAHARAFSLPSLRQELRADLNKVCVSSKRCLVSSAIISTRRLPQS